jgi:hypothetical protein
MENKNGNRIFFIQGTYYLITGLWPLINIQSFLAVTGCKTDLWLVKTFGITLACIGATILMSGREKAVNFPILFLSLATAASLTCSDFYYSLKEIISWVYLIDGSVEILLVLIVLFYFFRKTKDQVEN